MLVIEDILDQAARRLSFPPEVVRERNFYREGDTTHYGQPVKDAAPHRNHLATADAVEQLRPAAQRH